MRTSRWTASTRRRTTRRASGWPPCRGRTAAPRPTWPRTWRPTWSPAWARSCASTCPGSTSWTISPGRWPRPGRRRPTAGARSGRRCEEPAGRLHVDLGRADQVVQLDVLVHLVGDPLAAGPVRDDGDARVAPQDGAVRSTGPADER